MIVRFLKSKLFILFSFMLLTGFFIGYDYTVLTSKSPAGVVIENSTDDTAEYYKDKTSDITADDD